MIIIMLDSLDETANLREIGRDRRNRFKSAD